MSPSILIVDDDASTLELIEGYLVGEEYRVQTASTGAEALRCLRDGFQTILIIDLQMPEMDGFALCEAIRSLETVGFVYIIVLSHHSDQAPLLEAYRAGADDFLYKPIRKDELLVRVHAGVHVAELEEALSQERRSLVKSNAELEVLNHKLQELAMTDELTGLANRREAIRHLEILWTAAANQDLSLSCIMLDIDQFKQCNDRYGHAVGDEVLRSTAELLRSVARVGEVVCRIGGEELLIICPGSNAEQATKAAERIRREIELNTIRCDGQEISVTVSVGIAEKNTHTNTPEALMKYADKALYEAKGRGRNRVCVAAYV